MDRPGHFTRTAFLSVSIPEPARIEQSKTDIFFRCAEKNAGPPQQPPLSPFFIQQIEKTPCNFLFLPLEYEVVFPAGKAEAGARLTEIHRITS
jgi:hypothetical protein